MFSFEEAPTAWKQNDPNITNEHVEEQVQVVDQRKTHGGCNDSQFEQHNESEIANRQVGRT